MIASVSGERSMIARSCSFNDVFRPGAAAFSNSERMSQSLGYLLSMFVSSGASSSTSTGFARVFKSATAL